jgi:glycerol-3-phosphate acyltransferase PlsY
MPYVLAALGGFLMGSVPFAYLLVRWQRGLDLHAEGSTNVGASNALRTTGSAHIGASVLLLDALKGMAAVLVGNQLGHAYGLTTGAQAMFWIEAAALLAALAAHNYNPWLSLGSGRIVGGKGFATAAGGFLLLTPWLLLAWGVLFLVGRWAFARLRGPYDVIPGNVLATALVPVVAWPLYGGAAAVVTAAFALLTLPKHARQFHALLAAEGVAAEPSDRAAPERAGGKIP